MRELRERRREGRERERERKTTISRPRFSVVRETERKGGERVLLATEAISIARKCKEGKKDNGGEREERGEISSRLTSRRKQYPS